MTLGDKLCIVLVILIALAPVYILFAATFLV